MERLSFCCPVTGRRVDTGIDSELGTLLRIRDRRVRAYCPHCRVEHDWAVRDGAIEKAALATQRGRAGQRPPCGGLPALANIGRAWR